LLVRGIAVETEERKQAGSGTGAVAGKCCCKDGIER